jgi:hypothetical protein
MSETEAAVFKMFVGVSDKMTCDNENKANLKMRDFRVPEMPPRCKALRRYLNKTNDLHLLDADTFTILILREPHKK